MSEEKKKEVRQIVSGKVKQKTLADKAAETFLSEDTRTVKNYILWDVLIPGLKNAIADVVIGGIEMALFGNSRGRRSSNRGGYVSYENYSRDSRSGSSPRRVGSVDRSARYEFSNILLDTRGDAEQVVMQMEELVNKYGEASVADLNSLVGITGKFVDNKWGWTDCRDFSYRRSSGGYILEFNPPIYLD